MQRYYFLLENMYRAMIIFWLTCLVGYPRTSAPEPKSTETWERESTALIKLSKVLDCKRLIILTYELEEEIIVKDKKIEVIPVWKWLLDL